MKRVRPHHYVARLGPPGVDRWQCQACGDEGTLREVRSRSCRAPAPTQAERDQNLIDAIEGRRR